MVASKISVHSFDFLENCFLNYFLNILDSGRGVRDVSWKNKTVHRESNCITRRHFVLLDLILSFYQA